jgi:hypothetical protein
MLETVIIVGLVIGYLMGAAKMIRWASVRCDQPVPSWWDCINMMLWPALARRITGWVIPDAWQWPERWIGIGLGAAAMLAILILYFKLRLGYALLIFAGVCVTAIVLAMEVLPLLKNAK